MEFDRRRGDDLRQGRHRHAPPVARPAADRARPAGRMAVVRAARGGVAAWWCAALSSSPSASACLADRAGAAGPGRPGAEPAWRRWDLDGDRRADRVGPGATGPGSAVIAIVDSGIDLDHPDLAGRVRGGVDCIGTDGDPARCRPAPATTSTATAPTSPASRAATAAGEAGLPRDAGLLAEALRRACACRRAAGRRRRRGRRHRAGPPPTAPTSSTCRSDTRRRHRSPSPRIDRAVDDAWAAGVVVVAAARQPHRRRGRRASRPRRHRHRPLGRARRLRPRRRRARRGPAAPGGAPAPIRRAPTTTDPAVRLRPGSAARPTAAWPAPRWPRRTWPGRWPSCGRWATGRRRPSTGSSARPGPSGPTAGAGVGRARPRRGQRPGPRDRPGGRLAEPPPASEHSPDRPPARPGGGRGAAAGARRRGHRSVRRGRAARRSATCAAPRRRRRLRAWRGPLRSGPAPAAVPRLSVSKVSTTVPSLSITNVARLAQPRASLNTP